MAVLRPLNVIVNYPEGQLEDLEAVNNPENEARETPGFGRELYIEREDFMEDAERFSVSPSVARCDALGLSHHLPEVVRDDAGEIVELVARTTRKPRAASRRMAARPGTLHWVSRTPWMRKCGLATTFTKETPARRRLSG